MSGWVRLDKDMVEDPRLVEAALEIASNYVFARATSGGGENLDGPALLHLARNALLGALVTLWRYAHEHIRNDDTLPLRYAAIDALVGLDGFCNALPDCWIVELDDGTVKLPGYCEKNGLIAKRKRVASNAQRQARWRAKQAERKAAGNAGSNAIHNAPVTRYEDGYGSVTECGDLDLDLDLDSKKKTLRSSPTGDLSPSSSLKGEPDGLKNREEKKQKVETLVAELAAAKRWA